MEQFLILYLVIRFLLQVNLGKSDLREEILRGLKTSQCVMCNKGPSRFDFNTLNM